jgi:hypothetical protein
VKQRLKLAAVSPKLLEVYAEDGMTLDQLMAFTVNPNYERQEQVLCRYRHKTCWTNPLRGRGGCVERGVFPLEASPCLGPRHTRTATYSTAFQKRLPLARWCCCPRAASLLSRSSL